MERTINKNSEVALENKNKHPKGLYLLFITEMWERYSYYGMRSILVLYLTAEFISGGLGMDKAAALQLYGLYTGLVYFTPFNWWLSNRPVYRPSDCHYYWRNHDGGW